MKISAIVHFGLFVSLATVGCRNPGSTEESGLSGGSDSQGASGSAKLKGEVTVCYSKSFFENSSGLECADKPGIPQNEKPKTPDCWKEPSGGEEKIDIKVGTKVIVEDTLQTAKDPITGSPYYLYKVIGPKSLFTQAAGGFESCWIEKKYLRDSELSVAFDKAAASSSDASGVVQSNVSKTYLKISPQDSSVLLSPVPQPTQEAVADSLQRLRSAIHDPAKACLIPSNTRIAFSTIKTDSAGRAVVENGHVLVSFGDSREKVGSLFTGINFDGTAPNHPYYYTEPYLTHWDSLKALYPRHRDFANGAENATKVGLGCDLEKGWLFVSHFDGWKPSLKLK